MKKNYYSRLLKKESTITSGFFWNMMGCGVNALASVILLMFVNRINGAAEGGIFAFGYALAQQLWAIGSFETMTYQVTDTKNKYAFSEYYGFKILLCAVMLLASAVICFTAGHGSYEFMIYFLLCIFRTIDAFSNFFFSSLQKEGHLGVAGFSYFLRLVLANAVMIIILFFSKNLILSILISCVIEVLWVVLFELPLTSNLFKMKPSFRFVKMKGLFLACLPLFLSAFILAYINNLPKYAVRDYMTAEDVNTFSILFMPAFVINLLGIFIFRPMLTGLSVSWNHKNYNSFLKKSLLIIGAVVIALVLVMAAGYFLGLPVLSWFYGIPLDGYLLPFMIILLGGGFTALGNGLYNIITVMRKQRILVIGYVIGLAAGYICSPFLVKNYGLNGAALVFLISTLIVDIIFLIAFFTFFIKKKSQIEKKT